MSLIDEIRHGNRRVLARAISIVEEGGEEGRQLIREAFPHSGHAFVVGVTGAPGAGKSTLVGALTGHCRGQGLTVGVVAVDPTSPFTGGALLGDRLRMQEHALDAGVFIRSLATRGSLGGLSRATGDVVCLLDVAGFDVIFVETVGAGQAEVDIMRYAHTTLVLVTPGMGDEVQVFKAGIMEIGDVFAVNKADQEGADRLARELEAMLDLAGPRAWRPPVVLTVAREGTGVAELWQALVGHRDFARRSGLWEEKLRARAEAEVRGILTARLLDEAWRRGGERGLLPRLLEEVAGRRVDPYTAAAMLADGLRGG
ncbi:MAG: methylmalonyl Co-A mutase-associated GTPase MeaB [Bacillota bacterium]|nr:methylmalonyl Co-A mutase-associated GTPase MeaB [Bacillota bacterium]